MTNCERAAVSSPVTVTDSAGVRIVISEDASPSFAVGAEPLLSLGGPDAAGPTQFFMVRGIHIDSSGKIWVADGGSNEIRIFHPDGSHWKTVGGHGEGPGEFERLRLLGAFHGDSIAFWDDARARFTLYDSQGEVSRTTSFPPDGGLPPQGFDVFPDGTVLVRERREIFATELAPGDMLADSAHFARVDLLDLTRRPLGSIPGALWIWTGRNQIPVPFTANAASDLEQDRLHVASGPEFRIRVLEDGVVREIYGVARPMREVDPGDVGAYTAATNEGIRDTGLRSEYLSVVDHPERPRHLPAYSWLVIAEDGASWALVYSPNPFDAATSWDVFNRDREWLGQMEMPRGFIIHAVTDGRIYGVWRDDLGVEYVRVYGFQ